MARWLVQLDGEQVDLEEFPLNFPGGQLYATEKEGKVYLTGPEFEPLDGAEAVRNHAVGALDEMSAVISLLWLPFRKPSIGNVYRESDQGGMSIWMFPATGELRVKGRGGFLAASGANAAPLGVSLAPGHSSTEAQQLLVASRATAHLRTAMLLWASAEVAWWLLYRIVEDIETHLNECSIATSVSAAGYSSDNERTQFRRSANSAEVSGLGARHAAGQWDPPENPMQLQEAKMFVKGLLEQALRDNRI